MTNTTAEPAGIWLRVSTKQQDEQSQVPDIAAWVGSHGYDQARTYTVHGGSAFKGNRKFDRTWASVLDDMRAGHISVLVVWKTDRIDRKLNTFAMLADVIKAGGRVEFVTQPHLNDLTTMGGRISLKVQEEIAYAESRDKSDRIIATHAGLRAGGKLVGRYPWGFTSAGAKYDRAMVATPAGERYVPEIYTRIADGQTLPAVGAWLLEEHVPTAQDDYVVIGPLRPWHHRVIAAMIRNPAYRGDHQDASGRTICACPALVDGDLWRRAGASLDSRPSSRRGQRNDLTTAAAMLSGLVFCGAPDCTAGPDSPMYRYGTSYRCTGRGAVRKGCGCTVPVAGADALMNRAMGGIRRPVLRPVFHAATGHQVELDDITQALRDLPAQGLSDADEDARRAELRAERRRLEGLPATPARTEWIETGETYGQKWDRSDQAARRAWLRDDAGFAASLARPGMVAGTDEDDEHPDEMLSRTDVWTSDSAALVFAWTDDEDAGLARGLA
jgi:DNA invertase Pin-like site-specific DNA recombinase